MVNWDAIHGRLRQVHLLRRAKPQLSGARGSTLAERRTVVILQKYGPRHWLTKKYTASNTRHHDTAGALAAPGRTVPAACFPGSAPGSSLL